MQSSFGSADREPYTWQGITSADEPAALSRIPMYSRSDTSAHFARVDGRLELQGVAGEALAALCMASAWNNRRCCSPRGRCMRVGAE